MFCFETWFTRLLQSVINAVSDGALYKLDRHSLIQGIYSNIHLRGVKQSEPDLGSEHSLVAHLPLQPTTFPDHGWIVRQETTTALWLHRGGVDVTAPKGHHRIVHRPGDSSASIKRNRKVMAVMPGWDRIISAHGWPSPGDARVYLPTVTNPHEVADVVSALDEIALRWHMKTIREEEIKRPDSVVIYAQREDIQEITEVLNGVVLNDGGDRKIPGFSIPFNTEETIGVGFLRPARQEQSYGWSFASEIASQIDQTRAYSTDELRVKNALENMIEAVNEGKSNVALPW